jgi:hypothetical protein
MNWCDLRIQAPFPGPEGVSGWTGNCGRIQLDNEHRGLNDVKQPDRTMESVPRVAGFSAKDQPRLGATQAGAK